METEGNNFYEKKSDFISGSSKTKSRTSTPGNSYVSAVKKSTVPSTQTNPYISISSSKSPDSIARASPPITNLPISSSPSVSPVSEEALASPDFTDFKLVSNRKRLKKDSPTKTNNSIAKAEKISKLKDKKKTSSRYKVLNTVPTKDNICAHPFETKKPTSVDTQLLPMAVLPPLEKTVLQSRESDADAEMSSSSLSEEDALEMTCRRTWKTHLQLSILHPLPNLKRQTNTKTDGIIASVSHIVCLFLKK
ncbi:hypothetical protein AVEN_218276-1 [Araneus ventricosus]|uniref:Uncharacterized protein n=1 Tax=Araneus ventricosus TaxID=182803 RepID=A0A4Y2IQH9_ARAVE|nr:hypothetical protein AVEN_218276-1 [Araneus ventricosus]